MFKCLLSRCVRISSFHFGTCDNTTHVLFLIVLPQKLPDFLFPLCAILDSRPSNEIDSLLQLWFRGNLDRTVNAINIYITNCWTSKGSVKPVTNWSAKSDEM